MTILQLLPYSDYPQRGLAFDASVIEHHSFLFRPTTRGPATVTIRWYMERSNLGLYLWAAKVIPVPPGDVVDIPLPAECANSGHPHFFEIIKEPDHQVELPVDFSACTDLAILVIYRDSRNAYDTAPGDAMVTDVRLYPPAGRGTGCGVDYPP